MSELPSFSVSKQICVKNANINESHFHIKGLKPDHALKLKQK